MSNINMLAALTADALVDSWASSYIASQLGTWERSQARSGLAGAATLALGGKRVVVEDAPRARNAMLIIDGGYAVRLGFFHA